MSTRSAKRRVVLSAVLAAALISIPCLFAGFSGDDLVQRLGLEGRVPGYPLSPLSLYDFTPPSFPARALIDGGIFPWFASPELSLRFLRPVSSASLALDHMLFGRNAVLSHVQSWLWVVLLAGTGASLYQRWFSRGGALASALVFASVEQAEAGVFQRARFDFHRDLDGPGTCLLVWRGGRLETVPPPRVGESVPLAHEPGLMGL